MEMLLLTPGFLLGLLGWAATLLLIDGSPRLSTNDRRAMIVFSWMFWMIPGMGSFVLHGHLSTETTALVVTATTAAMGLVLLVAALVRPRVRR